MRALLVLLVTTAACTVPDAGPSPDAPAPDAPAPDAPPNIDAPPPVDAPDIDAPPVDAPDIDAPDIDAPPPVDAPEIDAPLPVDAPDIDASPVDAPTADAPDLDAPPDTVLVIEGTPFDVGMAQINTTVELTRTLRNISGSSTGVTLSTDGSELQILQHDCSILAAGATCTARVRLHVAAGTSARELRATPTAGPVAVGPITATGGHRLTVHVGGSGRVVSSPAGVDCTDTGTCIELLPPGPVTLTATGPGTFLRWMGAGCSGTAPCTINLTGPITVEAVFATVQPSTGLAIFTAGLGAGRVTAQGIGVCGYTHPIWPCIFDVASGTQVTLRQDPIGDSVFTGWQGCTPAADGTCTVTADATVTATFEPITVPTQIATWVRTNRRAGVRPRQITVIDDGIIVAGHTAGAEALWAARYHTQSYQSGYTGSNFIDDVTSGEDWVMRLADLPGGDIVILAMLAGDQPTARTSLRRYTQLGQLVWAVEPGGAQERCGLALDANNRIFVSGLAGTTPYIAMYSPTGFELARYTPAGPSSIEGLAIRGVLLAAVGSQGDHGWVGMFDTIGNLFWQRILTGNVPSFDLALSEVAIDSDSDMVFGGLDTRSTPTFVYGTVGPAEYFPQWYRRIPTLDQGTVHLLSHDRVRVFVGDPARIIDHDEAGNIVSTTPVAGTHAIGGLDMDAAGVTYLAGQSSTIEFPAIESRPAPGPSLAFTTTPVDLGAFELGTTPPPVAVTLRNTGSVSTGVVFTPSNAALVVVAHDCTAVAPGATCTVQLRMNLTAPGAVTHQLRAASTATGGETVVDVTAAAAARITIEIVGNGGSVASWPGGILCPGPCTGLVTSPSVGLYFQLAPGVIVGSVTITGGANSSCSGRASDECIVSALSGPVNVRVTFVPATLTIRQPNTAASNLWVFVGSNSIGTCQEPECRYAIPVGTTVTVRTFPGPQLIPGGTFHGWGGPCVITAGNECQVTVNGPTTVDYIKTAGLPEHWFRVMPLSVAPNGIAVTTAGVVVAGERNGAMWMGRYGLDGTPGPAVIGGGDRALAIAADPGGGFYILADSGGQRWLRRYADLVTLTWSIAVPVGTEELVTDAAGNVYVAGGSLVSYDAAGTLRWQVSLADRWAREIAIRHGVLGVAGTGGPSGWVAAFDLAGVQQWEHPLQPAQVLPVDVQVRNDGSLEIMVDNSARAVGFLNASAAVPPSYFDPFPSGNYVDGVGFVLTPQDQNVSLIRWSFSQIRVGGIAGTHVELNGDGSFPPGAITSDAAGNAYMIGVYGLERWPVVIRSQAP